MFLNTYYTNENDRCHPGRMNNVGNANVAPKMFVQFSPISGGYKPAQLFEKYND